MGATKGAISGQRITATLATSIPIWVTGTVYIAGDLVRYTGGLYVCHTGHTAGISFVSDLTTKWTSVNSIKTLQYQQETVV